MDDLMHNQNPAPVQPQSEIHYSSEPNFEEELRRQNIKTMIEIYGEDRLRQRRRNTFRFHSSP
ncbi:MAG: hypothetical protein H8E32_12810 [Nitrospinae bacterium]|nr:hypothetical protein [Nitrospinota bacterium]